MHSHIFSWIQKILKIKKNPAKPRWNNAAYSRYDTRHDICLTIRKISQDKMQASLYDRYLTTRHRLWYMPHFTIYLTTRYAPWYRPNCTIYISRYKASRYRPHYTIDISRYDTKHHDTGLTIRYISHDPIRSITIQASLYDRYLTIRYVSRYRPHFTIDISRYDTHHDTSLTIR